MSPTAVPTRAAAEIKATLREGRERESRRQTRACCAPHSRHGWYPPVGGVVPAGGPHRHHHLGRRRRQKHSRAAWRPHGVLRVAADQGHIAQERRPVPVRLVQHQTKCTERALESGGHSVCGVAFRSRRGPPPAHTCGPHGELPPAHPATRRWRHPPPVGGAPVPCRRRRRAHPSAGCWSRQTRGSVSRTGGRASEGRNGVG